MNTHLSLKDASLLPNVCIRSLWTVKAVTRISSAWGVVAEWYPGKTLVLQTSKW